LTLKIFSPILCSKYYLLPKEEGMYQIISKAISHGVYIITVRTKEKVNGMTAAWVSQVSFKPLLLMISIAPERFTHDLIKESGFFGINTLDEELQNYAATFGLRSGRKTDKFQGVSFSDGPNGSPVLNGALAFVECKVTETFTAGDHTLFIGSVVEAKLLKEDIDPLIFRWDDYF
jgi:flavin reductase (DIM6/NTAB) family NADH-FMN oxidoreductase RutF